ncbi:MAG: cytochrome c family protein [Sphingomonadaceae bacterium]|jgi:cytochrome c|nr:cytochrome c family protein [Sphingomonadaceae bacterium]NBU78812.1 cytochrome c family protein [Sphingomonadaceae bacterium]NCA02075.1 cytochrome c family protein [Sphingomonadaceae bacterium]
MPNHITKLALVLLVAAQTAPALAQAASPTEAGRRVFQRCAACHSVDANAPNRFGPNLRGVVGRKAASLPGYNYSAALKAQKFTWTEAQLDKWLKGPRTLVPGTNMPFTGLSDAGERRAVIAYLKSQMP